MENAENLSPKESLEIISKAIQQTRDNLKGQSFYFLAWGWLVVLAAVSHYLLLNFTDFKRDFLPWLIVTPIGWIACYIYAKRQNKEKPYETYIDIFLKHLWLVLSITIIIVAFIAISLKIQPSVFILLLTGVGTLISGLTMKFKPFIIGGVLFFLFAMATLYFDKSFGLLISAIAIIFGYLIPAYILKKS